MVDIHNITAKMNEELDHIHAFISEGNAEDDVCKKTLIALRLFSYLEYHHYAMKYRDGFKSIVQTKANDFRMVARERIAMLQKMDKTTADYGRAEYLAIITHSLKESCKRVLNIIQQMNVI